LALKKDAEKKKEWKGTENGERIILLKRGSRQEKEKNRKGYSGKGISPGKTTWVPFPSGENRGKQPKR